MATFRFRKPRHAARRELILAVLQFSRRDLQLASQLYTGARKERASESERSLLRIAVEREAHESETTHRYHCTSAVLRQIYSPRHDNLPVNYIFAKSSPGRFLARANNEPIKAETFSQQTHTRSDHNRAKTSKVNISLPTTRR